MQRHLVLIYCFSIVIFFLLSLSKRGEGDDDEATRNLWSFKCNKLKHFLCIVLCIWLLKVEIAGAIFSYPSSVCECKSSRFVLPLTLADHVVVRMFSHIYNYNPKPQGVKWGEKPTENKYELMVKTHENSERGIVNDMTHDNLQKLPHIILTLSGEEIWERLFNQQ